MSWLYERFSTRSARGDIITATRLCGSWTVRFSRAIQTNPYTDVMWGEALGRLPPYHAPDTLVLGLGGGGAARAAGRMYGGQFCPLATGTARVLHGLSRERHVALQIKPARRFYIREKYYTLAKIGSG